MKILVTGGAGFVGSHLCERLVKEGHEVYSLDNYFTGSENNHVAGVTYINGPSSNVWLEFSSNELDMIYHLGEYSRVEQSFKDIDKVLEYNKNDTLDVFDFARKNDVRIVYAGSSTKFVDHEDYIQSPYAWSKASNTELLNKYGQWFNMNYAITYFYNVYGPREISEGGYSTLIGKYSSAMKRGDPLGIVSPGVQTRNFTHVDDIVDALLLIGYNGYGDEFGIGASEAYSVNEVAAMFGGETYQLEARAGNRLFAPLVTDKTKALGWSQKHKLKDYIESLRSNNWN